MSTTTYYAYIDKAEPSAAGIYLEFHCLQNELADTILQWQSSEVHAAIRKAPSQVIVADHPSSTISRYFDAENIAGSESSWVILRTNTNHEGLAAQLFTGDEGEAATVYINNIDPLPYNSLTRQLLDEKISLDLYEDAVEEDVFTLISEAFKLVQAEFAAVYNVGQGNCNAICNLSCMPLLYFDLGGGCYANTKTYPSVLDFCFSYKPPILLSHWDTDHYQSAKLNSRYQGERWIVPRQQLGPVHLKFFLGLPRVMIWPSVLNTLNIPHLGTITRCTGPSGSKNHTGLALMLDLPLSMRNSIQKVLLPADAAYTYIPGATAQTFDGIVTTHHGAQFDHGNQPVCKASASKAIAYSYGSFNTYHHPKVNAVNSHSCAGWTDIRETLHGHIALSDSFHPGNLACGGGSCNLQIVQFY